MDEEVKEFKDFLNTISFLVSEPKKYYEEMDESELQRRLRKPHVVYFELDDRDKKRRYYMKLRPDNSIETRVIKGPRDYMLTSHPENVFKYKEGKELVDDSLIDLLNEKFFSVGQYEIRGEVPELRYTNSLIFQNREGVWSSIRGKSRNVKQYIPNRHTKMPYSDERIAKGVMDSALTQGDIQRGNQSNNLQNEGRGDENK